jgi:hypothetical protein
MRHHEATLLPVRAIAEDALELNDTSAEIISQLRALIRSIQPQLTPGSTALDVARIAGSIAEDWLEQLTEQSSHLRNALGRSPQVSQAAPSTTP